MFADAHWLKPLTVEKDRQGFPFQNLKKKNNKNTEANAEEPKTCIL